MKKFFIAAIGRVITTVAAVIKVAFAHDRAIDKVAKMVNGQGKKGDLKINIGNDPRAALEWEVFDAATHEPIMFVCGVDTAKGILKTYKYPRLNNEVVTISDRPFFVRQNGTGLEIYSK